MKYRKLGHSGLEVSEVSLGSWITYGGTLDDSLSERCIHRAFELGVNLFDTANGYSGGRAEEVLGRALAAYPRPSVVVATKVYWDAEGGTNRLGLSRKHIVESCEASLRRLDMDYVDLLQCHAFDEHTPLEETLRALDDLQRAGKILYAGVSNWPAKAVREAGRLRRRLLLRPLISSQPLYNLMHRDEELESQAACLDEGLGWIVYSPLAQGVLSGKYRPGARPAKGTRGADPKSPPSIRELLEKERLKKVQAFVLEAKKMKMKPAQLALAWCLANPVVSSVIIGASRPEQVEENVKASGRVVPKEVLARLDALFPVAG